MLKDKNKKKAQEKSENEEGKTKKNGKNDFFSEFLWYRYE